MINFYCSTATRLKLQRLSKTDTHIYIYERVTKILIEMIQDKTVHNVDDQIIDTDMDNHTNSLESKKAMEHSSKEKSLTELLLLMDDHAPAVPLIKFN